MPVFLWLIAFLSLNLYLNPWSSASRTSYKACVFKCSEQKMLFIFFHPIGDVFFTQKRWIPVLIPGIIELSGNQKNLRRVYQWKDHSKRRARCCRCHPWKKQFCQKTQSDGCHKKTFPTPDQERRHPIVLHRDACHGQAPIWCCKWDARWQRIL